MQNKTQYIRLAIMAVIMFALPMIVLAQGPPDPGGNPDVPIDGGLSLLLAAGVGYGAKKVHDARKKRKEEESEK